MRFSLYPRYPEWGASSRLRVFTLGRALEKLGHEVSFAFDPMADVTMLQKSNDSNAVARLPECKKAVYDFDDIEVIEYARSAQCAFLTTDTEGHAEMAPRKLCQAPCHVLPDPIDFCPSSPLGPSSGSGVTWFGISCNYKDWGWNGLIDTVLANQDPGDKKFVPWSLQTFPDDLRNSTSVAVLTHHGMDWGKSNNKMLCAITLGVPCAVGFSPAYEKLAHAMGLDWTVFRKHGELPDIIQRLKEPHVREQYLNVAQPYVWDNYHPSVIANRFLELCEGVA